MATEAQPATQAKRILVVEDEVMIRMLLEDMLGELGYTVAAEAARIDEALEATKNADFDLAILDANLNGQPVSPVADALVARGTPFVFATGYGELAIVPATAQSGARSKKHSSAPSPPALGHPAEGQQRVRSRYGRRAGRLHAATRRRLSAGLPRRNLEATHCRNARAGPDESGTPGPFRLRVRAQWHRQSLHDVCPARRLAPRQGHRSPYRRGLRSRLERLGRHPLRARQDHRSGPGQSQHPQQGCTLRSLSGRRSQAPGRALRMALHSKTRQLAQSGRV